MAIPIGEPAPHFFCPTPSNERFSFGTVAGRYVVMAFMPTEPTATEHQALAGILSRRALFDDENIAFFGVLRSPGMIANARDDAPGVRWFLDRDGEVFRRFGLVSPEGREHGVIVVLDPTLRFVTIATLEQYESAMDRLAGYPPPDLHTGVEQTAPILIVPRIFEPEFCKRLIDFYEADGGKPSGFMIEVNGRTVGVNDGVHKRRSDANIMDPDMVREARTRIERRLLPQVNRAFQFHATRMERYIVACYDSNSGGWFRPHRDNTTKGTAHRKFAVTLNLNAEDYEGGNLRFPEFGSRTYRAPTGGAVVFSCGLLHEATPVTSGTRYAFLPFLYDEAGAKLREQNNAYLDSAVGDYNSGDSKSAETAAV